MILTLCRHLTYRRMREEVGIWTENHGLMRTLYRDREPNLRKQFEFVDGREVLRD